MAYLKLETSCEIGNLIDVVCDHTGKTHDEVENGFFEIYKYPEGQKTAVGVGGLGYNGHWLYQALEEIMYQNNVKFMYITESI